MKYFLGLLSISGIFCCDIGPDLKTSLSTMTKTIDAFRSGLLAKMITPEAVKRKQGFTGKNRKNWIKLVKAQDAILKQIYIK
jgi:hypothetical protein